MCDASSDPTTYDAPTPARPRAYVLSGDAPAVAEPRGSVALAVIGEMLQELDEVPKFPDASQVGARVALLEARDRIARAER